MENRVGDNAPAEKKFAELLGQLNKALEELKKFGVTLSKEERKQLIRPRLGADKHVAQVHALAVKYGVTVPSIPLSGMEADARLAKEMHPLDEVAQLIGSYTSHTKEQAAHEYWQAFLAYYGVLGSMSQRNPELAAELRSVVEFMATGKRPKPVEPPK